METLPCLAYAYALVTIRVDRNTMNGFWVRSNVAEALEFYNAHYDIIARHILKPGKKEELLRNVNSVGCRFCGGTAPEVSFRNEAHAIPEAISNKTLFSSYECNACNQLFGETIENDFGNWSKPTRTLNRIRGKGRPPTLREGPNGGWRIEAGYDGLKITADAEDSILAIDEATKTLTLRLKRDAYTPVAVLKAFVKMGLTLLPEKEIHHFWHALQWIRQRDHSASSWRFPIFYAFQQGPHPNDQVVAYILRRKADVEVVPYAFLVLGYGNEVFQVMIPTPALDLSITTLAIPPLPTLMDVMFGSPYSAEHGVIDLCGHDVVRGAAIHASMVFEQIDLL